MLVIYQYYSNPHELHTKNNFHVTLLFDYIKREVYSTLDDIVCNHDFTNMDEFGDYMANGYPDNFYVLLTALELYGYDQWDVMGDIVYDAMQRIKQNFEDEDEE